MDPMFKVPGAFARTCTVCGNAHGNGRSTFPPECACGVVLGAEGVCLPNGHSRCAACLVARPLNSDERAWLAENADPGASPDGLGVGG